MTTIHRFALPASLLLALAVTGCSKGSDGVSLDELQGHSWALAEAADATGSPATALTDGDRAPIELHFQKDRLGITNACNGMGGNYTLKDNTLAVGNLMQTMMACEPPLMARESTIKEYLKQPLAVQLDNETQELVLENASGRLVFRPAPAAEQD